MFSLSFFLFFIFSFLHLLNFQCVAFFHFPFLSFFFFSLFSFSSFFIFLLFSFLFLFWVARNPIFLASNPSRFLVTFLVKKLFFEPSRRVPSLGSLFLFSLVYIFSMKKFSFLFLNFCSFYFFSRKKFLFSCTFFKYVSLLALVSEFNCFLSGRYSMEM